MTIKATELKTGYNIKRSNYEKGLEWIDTIEKIENYTYRNGKKGFKIFWKKAVDGYKTTLCNINQTFNKTNKL